MHYLQEVVQTMQLSRKLGQRTLSNGAQLIGFTPHIGPDAWLHLLFPPLSDSTIEQLESSIQIRFPEQFRDFFSLANGLSLFSGTLSIYGYRDEYGRDGDSIWQPFDIIAPNTVERLEDAKPSFLFVGGYPSENGSFLYVDTIDFRTYRCSRQPSQPLTVWDSFPAMLVSETMRLSRLFDEQGRVKTPNE